MERRLPIHFAHIWAWWTGPGDWSILSIPNDESYISIVEGAYGFQYLPDVIGRSKTPSRSDGHIAVLLHFLQNMMYRLHKLIRSFRESSVALLDVLRNMF